MIKRMWRIPDGHAESFAERVERQVWNVENELYSVSEEVLGDSSALQQFYDYAYVAK